MFDQHCCEELKRNIINFNRSSRPTRDYILHGFSKRRFGKLLTEFDDSRPNCFSKFAIKYHDGIKSYLYRTTDKIRLFNVEIFSKVITEKHYRYFLRNNSSKTD